MLKKTLDGIIKKIRLRRFKRNAVIGKDFRVDIHSVCTNKTGRRESITIGDTCCIRGRLRVTGEGSIRIGKNCYIGENSLVGAAESVTLGDCVIIAGDVHIMDNNNHPVEPKMREQMCKSGDFFGPLWSWDYAAHAPVVIESNVWIGEYCAILKGVHIGEGSIVGCHSVVTKDVPAYSVVAGNPARVVKQLERE